MVLETIIIKFSGILKIKSRNTFPEPQPDSASYMIKTKAADSLVIFMSCRKMQPLAKYLKAKRCLTDPIKLAVLQTAFSFIH